MAFAQQKDKKQKGDVEAQRLPAPQSQISPPSQNSPPSPPEEKLVSGLNRVSFADSVKKYPKVIFSIDSKISNKRSLFIQICVSYSLRSDIVPLRIIFKSALAIRMRMLLCLGSHYKRKHSHSRTRWGPTVRHLPGFSLMSHHVAFVTSSVSICKPVHAATIPLWYATLLRAHGFPWQGEAIQRHTANES